MILQRGRCALIVLTLVLLALPAVPCTAFLLVGNGRVMMGNNEDFWDPQTLVWFEPAQEGRFGSVFLGYTNMFPQGGMNEAGLAFDGFATGHYAMLEQGGKSAFQGNLINEAMATCATVEEVELFFRRYDLRFLETAMLMFADKSGASVIIEGDRFLRKQGDYQVVTNFYQSRQDDDLGQCPRYDAASAVLKHREEVSVSVCRRALAAAAQEVGTPTQYSNIFDLQAGKMYLYHFHNFEHVRIFDLAEELKMGKRVLNLPELFPETFAYKSFVAKKQMGISKRIEARRGPLPSRETLARYVGSYQLENVGPTPQRVVIRVEDQHLIATIDGQVEQEVLIPESEHVFFVIKVGDEQTITFLEGEDGEFTGLHVMTVTGEEYTARRVVADK